MAKWMDELVEYGSFGDVPVLVVAPHEGVSLEIVDGRVAKIGERGTGYLARLAARHIGGSYIVSHVPRMEADFARDPAELGKGARFKYNIDGEIFTLTSHRNPAYAGLLGEFHGLIERLNPRFLLTYHRMGGSDGVDLRFGFGRERQYIGGTENALEFKRRFLERVSGLEVLVSKLKLAGESEFILKSHYRGRVAGLVEFSSKLFRLGSGRIDRRVVRAARVVAELAAEWVK